MAKSNKLFKYTTICMLVIMLPLLTFVIAGFLVGAPLPGNEAAYLSAVPMALLFASAISIPLALCAGCLATQL